MDTLLIVVTALSLAMALGLAIVVAKLVGDDRRRSDARVAALTAMSAAPVPRQRPVEPAPAAAVASSWPIAREAAPAPRAPALPPRLADLEIRPGQPGLSASAICSLKGTSRRRGAAASR